MSCRQRLQACSHPLRVLVREGSTRHQSLTRSRGPRANDGARIASALQ
jgi:hypothetical protein